MSFLAPTAFLLAAALPVVVFFYLLKRKRTVKLVSSTLLWQRFLAETQASAPFQRLRRNWLLLLQLLLLSLVVLAAARPFLSGHATQAGLRVLILDASASMQSTDERPSRFEKARTEAMQWIDGMTNNNQMVLLLAGANTEVKQSATSDAAALRRALRSCAVSDAPSRLAEAVKLAATLTRHVANSEIHLFSDGAGVASELAEFENQNLPLRYHRAGRSAHNLGITSLEVRTNPDNPQQRAVFANIFNADTGTQSTEVELLFDEQRIETRRVEVVASNSVPLVFVVPQTRDGVFTVRLTAKDDLAADDQASILSRMPRPLAVLLVSRGNRFLEKALSAISGVRLSVATDFTENSDAFDVVVLDDVLPARWPAVNMLAIRVAETNWFSGETELENPAIVDWKNTHPLLRYVGFDNVQISRTRTVNTPPWAISLVDAPQTSLLLAGENERQRIVWIGFDTLQSTWPLRISFPIFIANAVDWLNPDSAHAASLAVRAGEPFRQALPRGIQAAEVTLPDRSVVPLTFSEEANEIVFGDTRRQGIYKLRAGEMETRFAVNLLNAAESDITPREELPLGKYARVSATPATVRGHREFWRWAVGAALVVLLFEWWFYHQRTA